MENNASSAGVEHGGLFNTSEIRILICYVLSAIDEPGPVQYGRCWQEKQPHH